MRKQDRGKGDQRDKPADHNPQAAEKNERHISGNVHVRGGVEVGFPEALIERYEAANEESYAAKQFWISFGTLIFIALTAIFSGYQGWLTRQIIIQTQENFTRDQAPYIWVNPEQPIIENGKPLTWNIQITNFGKGLAVNVHECVGIQISRGGRKIPPFDPVRQQPCPGGETARGQGVVPPTYKYYTTPHTNRALTDEEAQLIKGTDGGVTVYGVIRYEDSIGNRYESEFCSYHLITAANMDCEENNYIKQTYKHPWPGE